MKINIIGFKGAGKSTIGRLLSESLSIPFFDLDGVIEELYEARKGTRKTFREIYLESESTFRSFETEALSKVPCDAVVSVGGATPLYHKLSGKVVLIETEKEELYKRIMANGVPAFFDKHKPRESFERLYEERMPIFREKADFMVSNDGTPEETAISIQLALKRQ